MNYSQSTVWINEKFSLTEKKFREINYLVISLVKTLLSRNFCQKMHYATVCYFHEFPLISEIFRENKVKIFLKLLLQIMGLHVGNFFFIKSHENMKYRPDFVLIVRVEIFLIDQFIAEQLEVEVC